MSPEALTTFPRKEDKGRADTEPPPENGMFDISVSLW